LPRSLTLVDCKHLYGVIISEAPKWGIRTHTPQQMGDLVGHYKRQVIASAEQTHRMFPVHAADRNKLIEKTRFLLAATLTMIVSRRVV